MQRPEDQALPPALGNPERGDRIMASLGRLADLYAALGRRSPERPVRAVDRALPTVVAARRRDGDDVVVVTLAHAAGRTLPEWSPGAHVDLVLPSGRLRQYSLCGDPADRSAYRIAVRRLPDGDGGSLEIHDALPVGASLTVKGPRNGFPFAYPHLARADISSVLFIAGGIGITAILPMVRAAVATGIDWHLRYVGRSQTTMPLADEIRTLDPDRVTSFEGRRDADELVADAHASTAVYFCGPAGMLTDVRRAVDRRTVAGFHYERFAPAPVLSGTEFELHLAASGARIRVPADTSALAALQAVRPDAAYSCRQGFCGTCRVRVLAGTVERRGGSRFEAADDTMLVCVDRALGEQLTIDL